MKIRLASLFFMICGIAAAQYTRSQVYIAPGGVSAEGHTESSYAVGGGVERLLDLGVGVGADLSAVIPCRAFASNVSGIFSINGYYHVRRESRLDPFGTAGYSLWFRDYTANMFNFGGGVNYWFQDNLGLLVEFRDHVRHYDVNALSRASGTASANYWNFRIGLTFR